MNSSARRQRPSIRLALGVLVALMLIIVAAELATMSQPQTYRFVTDIAALLCAAIAAGAYIWAFFSMGGRDLTRRVWGLVGLGVCLWAIAEGIWAYYELVLGEESPYPGVADAFWLAGYVPVIIALVTRYRSYGGARRWRSAPAIAVLLLLYAALIVPFVFWPILTDFDPGRLLESMVSVAYPVMDSALIVLSVVIIFALERGRFANAWRFFGAGMILNVMADSLFSYLTWNEIYYPEGEFTALSMITDGLFNLQYLMVAMAIVLYMLSARQVREGVYRLVPAAPVQSLDKMDTLILAEPTGRIQLVSDNLSVLRGRIAGQAWVGLDIAEALGLPREDAHKLLDEALRLGAISTRPLALRDLKGQLKSVNLSAVTIHEHEMKLDMVALVLRSDLPAGQSVPPLTEQQLRWVQRYRELAGAATADERTALGAYLVAQINLLHSLMTQFTGADLADRLPKHLDEAARKQGWPFSSKGSEFALPENLEGEHLRLVVHGLLSAARRFAADSTNADMVEQESMSLDARLGAKTRALIEGLKLDARSSLGGPLPLPLP